MHLKVALFGILIICSGELLAYPVSSGDAKNHINRTITVCGKVAEVVSVNGDNFINLDGRYPHQTFTFYTGGEEINSSIGNEKSQKKKFLLALV